MKIEGKGRKPRSGTVSQLCDENNVSLHMDERHEPRNETKFVKKECGKHHPTHHTRDNGESRIIPKIRGRAARYDYDTASSLT